MAMSSILNVLSLIMIFGSIFLISFTESQSTEKLSLDCKKMVMSIVKKQVKAFGECSRDHKATYPDLAEYQRRIQCIVKCALEKEALLDENKQITSISIQHFLDANVPKDYHEIGHIFVDNCKAEFDGKMDAADETCFTYGEFVKCMQGTIAEYCM